MLRTLFTTTTKSASRPARHATRSRRRTVQSAKGTPKTLRPWSRVSTKALVDFTRSFAVMIRARLSLVQALNTAATQCTNARLKQILEAVCRDVQRGSSLSDSLAKYPTVFNSLFVHLAHIGEVAGILDQVLLRLASHLEKAAALRRKIQFALFYPGLILTVATGAIIFFLTTIVPTFAEMYADFGHQLPGPTLVVLQLSEMLTDYFVAVLLGMGLVIVSGIILYRSPRGRYAWDRLKLRLPVLGTLFTKSLTARFCQTLGTLLASGVALVDALSILAKASGNRFVEQKLKDIVGRVRRGSSLYQPLQKANFFPGMVIQLIAVGEKTAELDTMLLHAANHYEQEVDGFLDGLTSVLEPILIVVIGLMLGGILVSLYLPMFELINTVG